MDAALKFLGYRARTVRETERHLDECCFGEVEADATIERLKELKLLDDAAYAADFVRTRLATKPVSRAHLIEQLKSHETDTDAIDAALQGVTDEMEEASARSVAEKYARQFARCGEEERRERVLQRLLARGYAFDLAKTCAREASAAEGEGE